MKELRDLATQLRAVRRNIKRVKVLKTMATEFDAEQDLLDALLEAQDAACGLASDAQQLCNDLTDLITEMQPP